AAVNAPESLPMLEFVLDKLFEERTPQQLLTYAAYEKLGGLEGAIGTKADDVWSSLDQAARDTAPQVFAALVQMSGPDGQYRRKYASIDILAADPNRKRFVDAFIAARLFVASGANDSGGRVSLAHETLIARFIPLKQWVDDHRNALRSRARIAAAAEI